MKHLSKILVSLGLLSFIIFGYYKLTHPVLFSVFYTDQIITEKACFSYETHISYEYDIDIDSCTLYMNEKYESLSSNELNNICSGGYARGMSIDLLLDNGELLYNDLVNNKVIYNSKEIEDGITITGFACGSPNPNDEENKWGLSITIPNEIDGKFVVKIDDFVFSTLNQNLELDINKRVRVTSVNITSGIKYIGNYAFANNDIKYLLIPNTVRYIGKNAFSDNNLEKIFIPDGIEVIDNNAFINNDINDIFIGDSIKYIGENVFDEGVINN